MQTTITKGNLAETAYIGPTLPSLPSTLKSLGEFDSDAFVQRLRELVGDLPIQHFADRAGVSRTYVDDLLAGRGKRPSYDLYRKLASVRPWATVVWLAEGREDDEADITDWPQFHGWVQRMERQMERHLKRLAERQAEQIALAQADADFEQYEEGAAAARSDRSPARPAAGAAAPHPR